MPKNIFERFSTESSIFKDERWLYPEFVPERLPHRDSEIDSLAYALNPILRGGKAHNVFVFGPPGTGKTVCVKFVLQQLEQHSDRGKAIYINCFEYNTRYSILITLTNFLGSALPRRGLATDETYSALVDQMKKVTFTPVVILDEFDQLLSADEGNSLLYDLLRATEHQKNRFAIVLISNDPSIPAKLDARVKSSLSQDTLEFKQYAPQQLKEILRERADYAFLPDALGPDVINLAAAHAAKLGGDCRVAIEGLLRAGRLAQKDFSKQVTVEHLRKSFDSIHSSTVVKLVRRLPESEKLMLRLISKQGTLNAGEVYALYNKSASKPLSDRRLRDILNSLESQKLINAPTIDLGVKGRTRQISLSVPKDALLSELGKTA